MKYRKLISLILTIAMVLSSIQLSCATEIYSNTTDEMKDAAISEYGWETDKIDAYTWTGIDGEEYSRIYAYEEEMYSDSVSMHEKLAVDYGLLRPEELLSGMLGVGGGSIVAVALREAAAEDNAEVPLGSNHCKYNDWYGMGNVAWCVIFIIYCANECGFVESGLFPRNIAYCDGLHRYFLDEGFESFAMRECTQFGGSSYSAVPGDIVFFQCNDGTASFGHVGIVTAVGDGYMDITQGNTADKVMTIRTTNCDYGSRIVHVVYPAGTSMIFGYLTGEMGLNAAAACGIMGNLQAESGCEPCRVQGDFSEGYGMSHQYTEMVDSGAISRGDFINNGPGGGGYGLAQWTYFSRKANLYSFAKDGSVQYSIGDTYMQMMFLHNEAQSAEYGGLIPALQSVPNTASGVQTATMLWLDIFERAGVRAEQSRVNYALGFFAEYGGSV